MPKRAPMDADADAESVPKKQKMNVQEVDDPEPDDPGPDDPEPDDPHASETRLGGVGKPEQYVMCQLSWLGADDTQARWGNSILFVPLEEIYKCTTIAPAVHKAIAAQQGSDKMWKLQFATEDTELPREEDSRTVLNLQIDDEALVEALGTSASSTPARFSGTIVGHISMHTEM